MSATAVLPILYYPPVPDNSLGDTGDRAQVTWAYAGYVYTPVVSITVQRHQFELEIYNKYGDLKKIVTRQALVGWEYLRIGGCGQLDMVTQFKVGGEFDRMIRPGDEVRVKIRQELRYSGKLLKVKRRIGNRKEGIDLTFYGYLTELNDPIVAAEYQDMEVSNIVKNILDNYVVGQSGVRVTYDTADIEETDYAVTLLNLNHSVMDAIKLLGDLAGNFEWGVDRNKKFYFKRRSLATARTFNIGREIFEYEEIEDHEAVKNKAFVYGTDRDDVLATVNSSESASVFGSRQFNIFESAISEQADASRLGIVNVKNRANRSRQISIKTVQDDAFFERTHPLGGVAVVLEPMPTAGKYGNNFKYGENQKYGNIKEDQIYSIRYVMAGGGLQAQLVINEDLPNQGEQQKQIEFQIKELQRR